MSYSDLSTGLLLCFILITLFQIRANTTAAEKLKISQELKSKLDQKMSSIVTEMNSDEENCGYEWEADAEKSSIRIKFVGKKSWFGDNEAELREDGRRCLDKFIPKWIKGVFAINTKMTKKINEVRLIKKQKPFLRVISRLAVEGHTNSDAVPGYRDTKDARYVGNLLLSQQRSLETIKYILKVVSEVPDLSTPSIKNFTRSVLAGNGRSFAELIKENNVENKEESKRVEFKYHLEHIIEDVDSNGQKSIE